MATHLERSKRLAAGESLTAVTDYLFQQLGIDHRLLPKTDDAVLAQVKTAAGIATILIKPIQIVTSASPQKY